MDKKVILDRFNTYRHQIALGMFENPPAKNMRELVWNEHLAFLAQCETNKCDVKGTPVGNKNISQNKALIPRIYLDRGSLVLLQLTVDIWFQKIRTFIIDEDFVKNPSNPDRVNNKDLVQVMWAESTEVGCGRIYVLNNDKKMVYIICNFKKIDDSRKYIYNIGEPCSMCPNIGEKKGECHDFKKGLCKTYYFVPPPDPFDLSKAYRAWSQRCMLFLCLMMTI